MKKLLLLFVFISFFSVSCTLILESPPAHHETVVVHETHVVKPAHTVHVVKPVSTYVIIRGSNIYHYNHCRLVRRKTSVVHYDHSHSSIIILSKRTPCSHCHPKIKIHHHHKKPKKTTVIIHSHNKKKTGFKKAIIRK